MKMISNRNMFYQDRIIINNYIDSSIKHKILYFVSIFILLTIQYMRFLFYIGSAAKNLRTGLPIYPFFGQIPKSWRFFNPDWPKNFALVFSWHFFKCPKIQKIHIEQVPMALILILTVFFFTISPWPACNHQGIK